MVCNALHFMGWLLHFSLFFSKLFSNKTWLSKARLSLLIPTESAFSHTTGWHATEPFNTFKKHIIFSFFSITPLIINCITAINVIPKLNLAKTQRPLDSKLNKYISLVNSNSAAILEFKVGKNDNTKWSRPRTGFLVTSQTGFCQTVGQTGGTNISRWIELIYIY